jgi:arylsulfatase A-like enzyme
MPHLELGSPGEYLTDRLTGEALRVIDHAAAHRTPFFLLLAHHAPHTPIEAKPGDVAYFEGRVRPGGRHRNPVYAAMIRSLDESVGRILGRLRERGIEGNTLVVFASDNGGYLGTDARQTLPVTTNAPLRSGKGTLYEGGVRVPLIVRWPGVTPTGAVCEAAVVLTDLHPTLLSAAGLKPSDGVPADGLDLREVLRHPQGGLEREALFFHYPHYYHAPPSTPASAVRAWPWKLVEYFETGRAELFNLQEDPGEERDLAAAHPEIAARLRGRLAAWRTSVGAALPRPNPDYDAAIEGRR